MDGVNPLRHVDFGSHVYFAGVASAITDKFTYYDIRPIDMPLPRLECKAGNLTKIDLPDNSQMSVSCMHVLEHVGLGRYGDSIDPRGDLKAAAELSRIVHPDGQLLIVEPVNQIPRLSFNAHRIYSYNQILDMFSLFRVRQFTLIKGREIIWNAQADQIVSSNDECNDTACFVFEKRDLS
jgi:hypothetical protein